MPRMKIRNVVLIKIAAATAIISGLVFGFIEKLFAPDYLVAEGASARGWMGLIFAAIGTASRRPGKTLPPVERRSQKKQFLCYSRFIISQKPGLNDHWKGIAAADTGVETGTGRKPEGRTRTVIRLFQSAPRGAPCQTRSASRSLLSSARFGSACSIVIFAKLAEFYFQFVERSIRGRTGPRPKPCPRPHQHFKIKHACFKTP